MVIEPSVVVLMFVPFVGASKTVKPIEPKWEVVGGRWWGLGEEGSNQVIDCGLRLNR